MTYEAPEVARKVFDRVDFHSIVVTDQSGRTQINFGDGKRGLNYYPLTVLIDRDGIIRWYGSPKDLDEAMMERFLSGEEASPPRISGRIDQKTFSDWFGDSTITWMVHLTEVEEQPDERSASFFMQGLTGGFDACIILEELLRRLFPGKRFVLPPAHFTVSIRNAGSLAPDAEVRFSSYSFDAGNLVFSQYTIADMLAVLSEYTDHEWTFAGTDRGKYAFRVDLSSGKAMLNSLKSYGLKVSREGGEI